MEFQELLKKRPTLGYALVTGVITLLVLLGTRGPWVTLESGARHSSDSISGWDAEITADPTPWLLSSGTVGLPEGVAVAELAVAGAIALAGSAAAEGNRRGARSLAWVSAGAFGLAVAIIIVDWVTIQMFLYTEAPGLYRVINIDGFRDLQLTTKLDWGFWLAGLGSLAAAVAAISAARELAPIDQAMGSAPASVAAPRARRLSVEADGQTRQYTLREGEQLLVGREQAAAIVVSDSRVSRRHLSVGIAGGRWVIADLGATNRARIECEGTEHELPAGGREAIDAGSIVLGGAVLRLFPVTA